MEIKLDKKYAVVYADPPWRYDFSKDSSDKIEAHYPTMALEEIKAMEIPTEDNAVLFLWATAPKLIEALEVMKAWGFEYKTNMIWHKNWIGMGYWFRGNHELLLVGTKGKFSPPKYEERIDSVLTETRREHSRKPYRIRTLISKWYPNLNKIELFARDRLEGWDSQGNQTYEGSQKLMVNNI